MLGVQQIASRRRFSKRTTYRFADTPRQALVERTAFFSCVHSPRGSATPLPGPREVAVGSPPPVAGRKPDPLGPRLPGGSFSAWWAAPPFARVVTVLPSGKTLARAILEWREEA